MDKGTAAGTDASASSPAEHVRTVDARTWDRRGLQLERQHWVIQERAYTLHLNGRECITLLCAGHHVDELAVGFFHGEGFLDKLEDLREVVVDQEAGTVDVLTTIESPLPERLWQKRTVTTGCGKGSLFYYALDALLSKPVESSLTVFPRQIVDRIDDLNRLSETYRHTHGVHNTALVEPDRVILFRDDIGRHNAVDMIAGYVFMNRISLCDKLLLTTGRLTSEIIIKAAKIGLAMIVSRNTASSLAIELARSLNITLIGYARAGKFTVYSRFDRVVSE
jgi:FdhD protein